MTINAHDDLLLYSQGCWDGRGLVNRGEMEAVFFIINTALVRTGSHMGYNVRVASDELSP